MENVEYGEHRLHKVHYTLQQIMLVAASSLGFNFKSFIPECVSGILYKNPRSSLFMAFTWK